MSKITIDAVTVELLKAAGPDTILTGPDGQPVAGVVPLKLLAEWEWMLRERERLIAEALSPESIDELNRIEAEGGGIPHDEVMKRLGLA